MQRAPYDEEAFSREVVARWGHLSESLAFDEGLVHSQMGHLGLLCVTRPGSAKAILQFLAEVAERDDVSPEIRRAITESFLDWGDLRAAGLVRTVAPQLAPFIKG